MKQYINRQEQEDLVYISALIGHLKDFIERDNEKKSPLMDKATAGWCKRANTILYKQVLKPIMDNLDVSALSRLVKTAKGSTIQCVPTYKAEMDFEKAKKDLAEEEIIVKVEALDIILDHAFYGCSPCVCKNKQQMAECKVRQAYESLNVQTYDDNPPAGICPYANSLREEFENEKN